ncbi:MAG: helix-turn-helix domain-containing protein [Muribaculaceae bacterium]|nr:helix-turn-helix domain-containing protein [Muribaculaceae bacterium]
MNRTENPTSPQYLMMVSPEDFASAVECAVAKAMTNSKPKETYLTVDEAASRLGVSRSTLWRWDKEGYLTKIKRGKKNTYRLSDVERIINGELV